MIKKINFLQKNSFKKVKENQKGFSLVESLLAITILMISVSAPMTMAWHGLLAAKLAEDKIIANYLAQDALEYIRNKRDYNKLSHTPNILDDNIFGECKITDPNGTNDVPFDDLGNKGCSISTLATVDGRSPSGIFSFVSHDNSRIKYHSGTGIYDHTIGGVASKFSRQVRIGYIAEPDSNNIFSEAIVEVTVRWNNEAGITQKYKIRDHLLNW